MRSLFNIYASPVVQVVMLGLICLCCPGMFNALSGLGAGGLMAEDINLTNTANSVLYACFAVVGFFAGSVTNKLGVRWTLTIGTFGYAVYSSSLWVYDRKQVSGYVIAAGAILGCCAGLLWSAQGAIMMAYPEEKNKGKYVAIFWGLFNIGGILGSVITLGLNLKNQGGSVQTGTYVAFVVIMIVGVFLSLALVPPSKVSRADGTKVSMGEAADWKSELKGVVNVWREWRMIALIPAFLASNWFYSYQFHLNTVYFDAVTRALNGTMYWTMQIVGSLVIGLFLDYQGLSRRARGLIGVVVIFLILMGIWAGGFAFQLTFENDYNQPLHWSSPGFAGPFVLYMLYGFSDAVYQSYMYWLMGAMSNDPTVLSRYAGFYKAVQSAGAACAFGIDTGSVRLRWAALISWLLLAVAFPLIGVVANQIKPSNMDATDSTEDVKTTISFDLEEKRRTPIA
ncbi:major facilitator superfamily domain-containing protein [Dichotomocladium elegans]|nr:major facilitator superfamily domain-containing protein [Dichotomocladium elegans]